MKCPVCNIEMYESIFKKGVFYCIKCKEQFTKEEIEKWNARLEQDG